MKERSHCPTSWSASGVVSVLGLGHSNRYVVVFHCFIFANNDLWHWASSHMRLCHLYIFFVEVIMPCYFLHFWWLHIGGLADSGVPAPPQTRQFLETVNDLSACLSCENHQPGVHIPTTSSMGLSRPGPLFACSNHLRARQQTPGTAPVPQSLLGLFRLANSKPADLALPGTSH